MVFKKKRVSNKNVIKNANTQVVYINYNYNMITIPTYRDCTVIIRGIRISTLNDEYWLHNHVSVNSNKYGLKIA